MSSEAREEMPLSEYMPLEDVQSNPSDVAMDIDHVGVRHVRFPLVVKDRALGRQHTVASVDMGVELPSAFKGTHMSRFVEILNRFHERFTLSAYQRILEEMKVRLNASAAHLEMAFPYFFTPARQGALQPLRYDCRLLGTLETSLDLTLTVDLPMPGLAGGALACVSVRMRRLFWIEELIEIVEGALAEAEALSVEEAASAIGQALADTDTVTRYQVLVKQQADGYSSLAVCAWPDSPDLPETAAGFPFSSGPLAAPNF